MDKTIRKYTSFDEMKTDEYRYWQSRPVHKWINAVSELTQEQYEMKCINVPRLQELLSVLNAHRVKYLVVGAYAVASHAQPRATKGLDISLSASPENAKAVFFGRFGAPLPGLTAADFAEQGPLFRMGREPIGIDGRRYPALTLMRHGAAGWKR